MSQSEISLKKFQIVEWICPGRKTVTRKLDIVPYKWLDVEKKNSKFNLKCRFPPSNYELVPKLVREEQEPDFNWKLYSVIIAGDGETYEEAEEHYNKIEIGLSQRGYSTTDSENKGDHDEKEETIKQELIRSKFQAQEAAMNKEALKKKKPIIVSNQIIVKDKQSIINNNTIKEKTKNNLAVLLDDDEVQAQTMTNETSNRNSCGNSWNYDVTVEPEITAVDKKKLNEITEKQNRLEKKIEDDEDLAQTMTNETSNKNSCGNSWNYDVTVEPEIIAVDKKKLNEITENQNKLEKKMDKIYTKLSSVENLLKKNIHENKKVNSVDWDFFKKKYNIKTPIAEMDMLERFENKLTLDKCCNKDTINVMETSLQGIDDCSKGARIILKKFLSHDIASGLVVQQLRKDKSKKIMKKELPKFLNCIKKVLIKKYVISEERVLSKLGYHITRANDWNNDDNNNESDKNDDSD